MRLADLKYLGERWTSEQLGTYEVEVFIVRNGKMLSGTLPVESKTPAVLKMEPANGTEDVDADAVKELRVTFDRDMDTTCYAWCGIPDWFPEKSGEAVWIDKRTCVAPVKLEPNRKYMFTINSIHDQDFKSAEGVAVVPAVFTFKTKAK